MTIIQTFRDSGRTKEISLESALLEISGGTSKYNEEIKEKLTNGMVFKTDYCFFTRKDIYNTVTPKGA